MKTEEELREAVANWEWEKWKAVERRDLEKAGKPIPASEEEWKEHFLQEVYRRKAFHEAFGVGPDYPEWCKQHDWPSIGAVEKLLAHLAARSDDLPERYEGHVPFFWRRRLLDDLLQELSTATKSDPRFDVGLAVGWKLRELADLAGIGVNAAKGLTFDQGPKAKSRRKTAATKPTWRAAVEAWKAYKEEVENPSKTDFAHNYLADWGDRFGYEFDGNNEAIRVAGNRLSLESIRKRIGNHL